MNDLDRIQRKLDLISNDVRKQLEFSTYRTSAPSPRVWTDADIEKLAKRVERLELIEQVNAVHPAPQGPPRWLVLAVVLAVIGVLVSELLR